MTRRKKITLSISIAILLSIVMFGSEIEDGLACLAYYDQCTAERVMGLTQEQCLAREDSVAFLLTGEVCLVKPSQ